MHDWRPPKFWFGLWILLLLINDAQDSKTLKIYAWIGLLMFAVFLLLFASVAFESDGSFSFPPIESRCLCICEVCAVLTAPSSSSMASGNTMRCQSESIWMSVRTRPYITICIVPIWLVNWYLYLNIYDVMAFQPISFISINISFVFWTLLIFEDVNANEIPLYVQWVGGRIDSEKSSKLVSRLFWFYCAFKRRRTNTIRTQNEINFSHITMVHVTMALVHFLRKFVSAQNRRQNKTLVCCDVLIVIRFTHINWRR